MPRRGEYECDTRRRRPQKEKKPQTTNPRQANHGRREARDLRREDSPEKEPTGLEAEEEQKETDSEKPEGHAKDKQPEKRAKKEKSNMELTRPKGRTPSLREPEIRPSQKSAKRIKVKRRTGGIERGRGTTDTMEKCLKGRQSDKPNTAREGENSLCELRR